ncbi:hypothetical protein ACU8KH_02795 [Lachancea thermotolerans]
MKKQQHGGAKSPTQDAFVWLREHDVSLLLYQGLSTGRKTPL